MITKNEAYWERIARIKEEMLSVSYKENEALKATLAMINPQQSPWREYWESLLKENEELRMQVATQPEQEPVGYQQLFDAIAAAVKTPYEGVVGISVRAFEKALGSEVYTTPPQRKPLTDEQIAEIYVNTSGIDFYLLFARAIESVHGIKE